jgi:hypothetical protein
MTGHSCSGEQFERLRGPLRHARVATGHGSGLGVQEEIASSFDVAGPVTRRERPTPELLRLGQEEPRARRLAQRGRA